MWYFAWILGVGLASTAAILNGMWFEAREGAALDAAD
ncbi:cytochrome bd-I oxidase subunit CydX [Xanthomonas translucens]|nr:cytochrome bd-I oxidase subunit CydX [Xanthomonas translucens]KTF40020.1 cytochrome bd biosynthesis protein [Xanthomonas translucens pv. translucens]KWV10267.1 cytochrome bd biosynthesis protein [Xanthomonas translucens]MCS3359879.1 cytochrome bd-I oxidase subunit CydX [Xanthomonas translucens pv. translucens]MCS3373681.1 cytochrome bd-I oxidase subunit CydX [Xanthomonas translucens pv. translucens]MCT8274361.1 cytochrome bd-I oxidase subunit CydX [Xanthomonas translucens pv. translucens]